MVSAPPRGLSAIAGCLLNLVLAAVAAAQGPEITIQGDPPLPPDSMRHEGVLKGEILKFSFNDSKIFPGTVRDYWVYIPQQYQPDKPACLFVCQDGLKFEAPTVFDNLIASGEMPVTIGVFIMHGRVKAADEKTALDRFNRSYEYDGRGDNYARFLIEELLPDVEKQRASDGRAIRLSQDPNDRAIGGSSSGAVCAFTAAWERPDSFRRIYSSIGTYVGLRGGDEYHTLVRKYEPKPLRVYLQDGTNDLNIYAGDWWMANQTLERALTFAGYEVTHVWGDGAHNAKQATPTFPDAMRWLWKDWPKPIAAGESKNGMMRELLIPGEGWELVADGYKFTEGPAAGPDGAVYFNDVPNSKTYRVDLDGKVSEYLADSGRANGQAFGPDGRLYAVAGGVQQVVAYDVIAASVERETIAEGIHGNDLVVAKNGNVYVTEPGRAGRPSSVWLIRPDGSKAVVDQGLKYSNGVTLSPDQSLLYVADSRTRWVYSYSIKSDGTTTAKQEYFHLHEPDDADSGADGLCVDRGGRLYVATRLGVQVCDQPGRVNVILPTPNGKVSNVRFGGPNFDILYATCGDAVYRRKLNTRGAAGWDAPTRPPVPGL